ncbi:type II secretion system protein [Paenibacillus sp. FSL P4-0081]|uniref:type II secretion system protein n=1 Tax=Paenibacillus sp. FSL P4-0081 TaxID=1536769 RepID=UPI0006935730|nr:prepilin-type N-terminal cleavage/methylation domain-containing protein [Paenibacillus sp. FSL P4-0081]
MLAQAIKRRISKEENQKGFTLIELLAVIVILGIIAVIAIPLIGNIVTNSREDADLATARQVYEAARLYVIGEQNGNFVSNTSVTLETLQTNHYIEAGLVLPSTKVALTPATTLVKFTADGILQSVTLTPAPAKVRNGLYTASQIITK